MKNKGLITLSLLCAMCLVTSCSMPEVATSGSDTTTRAGVSLRGTTDRLANKLAEDIAEIDNKRTEAIKEHYEQILQCTFHKETFKEDADKLYTVLNSFNSETAQCSFDNTVINTEDTVIIYVKYFQTVRYSSEYIYFSDTIKIPIEGVDTNEK